MQTLFFPMYTSSDVITKDAMVATAVPTNAGPVPSANGNLAVKLSSGSPISLNGFKGTFGVFTTSTTAPALQAVVLANGISKITITSWTNVRTVVVGGTSYYLWSSSKWVFSHTVAPGQEVTVNWNSTSGSTFNVYNATLSIVAEDLGDYLTVTGGGG